MILCDCAKKLLKMKTWILLSRNILTAWQVIEGTLNARDVASKSSLCGGRNSSTGGSTSVFHFVTCTTFSRRPNYNLPEKSVVPGTVSLDFPRSFYPQCAQLCTLFIRYFTVFFTEHFKRHGRRSTSTRFCQPPLHLINWLTNFFRCSLALCLIFSLGKIYCLTGHGAEWHTWIDLCGNIIFLLAP